MEAPSRSCSSAIWTELRKKHGFGRVLRGTSLPVVAALLLGGGLLVAMLRKRRVPARQRRGN